MSINLSIAGLFEEVFGYKGPAFEPELDTVPARETEGKYGAPYYAEGLKGREYYMPVEVHVGSDNAEALGAVNNDGSTTGRWRLPYPLVSVSNTVNIVDTPLTERRGMVSEFINVGGWRIMIRGFLIGAGGNFPEKDFETLTRLFALGKVVRISSVITDVLLLRPERGGTDEVVVRNIEVPGLPGVPGVRPYTLELVSNEPFNLTSI